MIKSYVILRQLNNTVLSVAYQNKEPSIINSEVNFLLEISTYNVSSVEA